MEVRTPCDEVLSHYLCLFRYGGAQLKYFMAPDALVDWFGRPIYGTHRISDLMRYHVHMQYEHINFDVARVCGAIECKPCHMKTKIRSKRELDPISSLNQVTGCTSLKSSADSDNEMDTESKKSMSDNSTLTMCTSSPDKVANKEVPDSDEDSDDVDEGASKAKRLKRSPSTQSCSQTKKNENPEKIPSLLDDTSDEEDESTKPPHEDKGAFTPLHYIETYGRLRARNFAGHQAHGKAYACSHFKYKDAGEVRIRMSYRRHLSDNTIEYVLIIYEHLRNLEERPAEVRLTRRNLMAEFTTAAIEESAEVREAAIAVEAAASNNSVNADEEETASDVATGKTTAENEPSGFLRSEPSTTSEGEDPLFLIEALSALAYQMRTPEKRGPIPPSTPKRRPLALPFARDGTQSPSPGKVKSKNARSRNLRL